MNASDDKRTGKTIDRLLKKANVLARRCLDGFMNFFARGRSLYGFKSLRRTPVEAVLKTPPRSVGGSNVLNMREIRHRSRWRVHCSR